VQRAREQKLFFIFWILPEVNRPTFGRTGTLLEWSDDRPPTPSSQYSGERPPGQILEAVTSDCTLKLYRSSGHLSLNS